ncbi:hypothetical protein B0A54_06475 [Friedmanniomyces endolithicus]|uniref:Uncharacterized protein n=1 Tax=Friedmanniomyces endolithicus TaxID=329885 RepID=A0A4U0UZM9_9PEZI|nr:hypothetical protein B0A54_06475 [Friedmanniomyces endolithicus]
MTNDDGLPKTAPMTPMPVALEKAKEQKSQGGSGAAVPDDEVGFSIREWRPGTFVNDK